MKRGSMCSIFLSNVWFSSNSVCARPCGLWFTSEHASVCVRVRVRGKLVRAYVCVRAYDCVQVFYYWLCVCFWIYIKCIYMVHAVL